MIDRRAPVHKTVPTQKTQIRVAQASRVSVTCLMIKDLLRACFGRQAETMLRDVCAG